MESYILKYPKHKSKLFQYPQYSDTILVIQRRDKMSIHKNKEFIIYEVIPKLSVIKYFSLNLNIQKSYLYVNQHLTNLKKYVKEKTLQELYSDKQKLKLDLEISLAHTQVKTVTRILTFFLALITITNIPLNNQSLQNTFLILSTLAVLTFYITMRDYKGIVDSINKFMYEESFKIIDNEINKKITPINE